MTEPRRYVVDVETESIVDLKKAGAYAYSAHPSTDLMCISWRELDAPPEAARIWFPTWADSACPVELIAAIARGDVFIAFNAFFEQCIWNNVLVARYGWPAVPIHRWHCAAALAAYYGYPQSLERCMAAMKLGEKDAEGRALMLKMCNPSKRTKKTRAEWLANMQRLGEYCQHDVNDEALIVQALPPLPKTERSLWVVDQEINHRGIPFDVDLVDAACHAVETIRTDACATLKDQTDGVITTPNQRDRILKLCADNGVELENLTAPTVEETLKRDDLLDIVRFVLETRAAAGTAAVKKFIRAQQQIVDGRARGLLRYFGAHTGRWTGQGVQPSNMPRAHFDSDDETQQWVDFVKGRHFVDLVDSKDLTDGLTKLVRPSICAPPDRTLVAGDFSGIELRVLHWLVGDTDTINTIRTKGSGQVYLNMAATIFGRRVEKSDTFRYTTGKVGTLALGYQGARGAFQRMAESYGIDVPDELADRTVTAYRAKNRLVCEAWKAIERRALSVVSDGGKMTWRCVTIEYRDGSLVIALPSGREMWYRGAHIAENKFGPQVHYWGDQDGRWKRLETYGGLLVENIVQAISRDILVLAMFAIVAKQREIVSHCYDEIVCECDIVDADSCLSDLSVAMTTSPRWAKDLPLAVDTWVGERYRK